MFTRADWDFAGADEFVDIFDFPGGNEPSDTPEAGAFGGAAGFGGVAIFPGTRLPNIHALLFYGRTNDAYDLMEPKLRRTKALQIMNPSLSLPRENPTHQSLLRRVLFIDFLLRPVQRLGDFLDGRAQFAFRTVGN